MLLEEFDNETNAVINPSFFKEKTSAFPKVCVAFFSKSIMKNLEKLNPEVIGDVANATHSFPVYKLDINGTAIAVYHAAVGAPAAVGQFEELIAYGAEKFLFVGYCGCLDGDTEEYSIIIPTKAIRDEGTSYHYLPASDFVELNGSLINAIETTLNKIGIGYKKGITWTTDAAYRETPKKVARRKEQGAITVEMEAAALAAVAKFRKVKYAHLLYSADNLGSEQYDPRILITHGQGKTAQQEKILGVAFECVSEIAKL